MKQTAIEWFTNQLEKHYVFQDIKNTTAFLHAKEREKEQIKGSWNHGFDWGMMEQSLAEQGAESTLIDAEHYYNETFNTNEK